AQGPRRPDHALHRIEALAERTIAVTERRARLDPTDHRPDAIRRFDRGEREPQRSAKRARRNGSHEDEIADARIARIPTKVRVADARAIDRPAEPAAPPDDVLLGDDVLDLR